MGLPKDAGLGSQAWGPYIQSMTETLDDTVKNNLIKNIITNVEKMG